MSLIHLELLNKNSQEVLKKLAVFAKEAILGGGTALSLQLAHRYSYDFDLFFPRKIQREDFIKLRKVSKIKKNKINNQEELTVIIDKAVQITLWHYPFKNVAKTIKTDFIALLNYQDIGADKSYTLGRRAVWRDYVDLFWLLKNTLSLSQLITFSKRKFKKEFSEKQFLEQLVYFKDIKNFKIEWVKEKYQPEEIKDFLVEQVKKYKKIKVFSQ